MTRDDRTFRLFEAIAKNRCGIETLRTRGADGRDFHTVSVWALVDMMQTAYDAGYEAAQRRES